VHWLTVPQEKRYQLGRYPVNFWQVPNQGLSSLAEEYLEFYSLPVTDQHSRVKMAFHNGLAPCDPDFVDASVSPAERNAVNEVIASFLPCLQGHEMATETCLYTTTSDGHFYLGRRPGTENVYGVALAGHGFKFAPILGEILADLLEDVSPAYGLELFLPERFC
jgi:sarcosine oxidase